MNKARKPRKPLNRFQKQLKAKMARMTPEERAAYNWEMRQHYARKRELERMEANNSAHLRDL